MIVLTVSGLIQCFVTVRSRMLSNVYSTRVVLVCLIFRGKNGHAGQRRARVKKNVPGTLRHMILRPICDLTYLNALVRVHR